MFSNLTQGSILYGVGINGDMKLFTAPVVSVSIPRQKYTTTNGYPQLPEMVVDIVATVNGERKEFKQVPSNAAIADFGSNSLLLADSRESLNGYVTSMLQTSRNILNSIDEHKRKISLYEQVLADLNPNLQIATNDKSVQELRDEVGSLKSQLAEAIALLKSGNNKQV